MTAGGFTFVLHSHMPFYRGAGRWPHGEEALHEVMSESYIPLLEALTDLMEADIQAKVTLGITPVLAEQLADPLLLAHFEEYMEQEIEGAEDDVRRFQANNDQHFLYLAHYYLDWYRHVLQTFQARFGRDINGGFRRLQDAGAVEILTSAATHPYLPLMSRDSTIYAQLAIGKRITQRHFGREPRAIWLPECAYRPGYYANSSTGDRYERPGLEYWLQNRGLHLFFSEASAVEGSRVIGRAERLTREVLRPTGRGRETPQDIYSQAARNLEDMDYESTGFVTEKRIVPFEGAAEAGADSGTFEAYLVRDSDVSVLGRNQSVGAQVWSADYGYPGDAWYREFHKKDGAHGFQYWRVTEDKPDLAYKQPYDPYKAGQRVQEHAGHFVWLVESELRNYATTHGNRPGIIASAYDTELFGHWWFEGVAWLKEVLTRLAADDNVQLLTATEWLDRQPTEKAIDLPESSWGHHGTHVTWLNPDTQWMWDTVHDAEARMEALVSRFPDAQGVARDALNQAARELTLLESSDWEFLHTTGQARQYASDRFSDHANRFNSLADALENRNGEESALALTRSYAQRDNLFPDIDYRLFARRQPE
jgi:1,4-alpha-glucan branching enzyme